MRRNILIFLAMALAVIGCRNSTPDLNADVEIPVSVQDVSLKSIEEYVNTSGTVYPKGDIELKSEITAKYFLDKNPATGKLWQLNDRVKKGDLIARLEDREYINSIKMETTQLNLDLTESELKKQQ